MLSRWIDDFVYAELALDFHFEACLFLEFSRCGFCNAFEGVDLASRQNPAPSLWILVTLAQEDTVCCIPYNERGSDSGQRVTHATAQQTVCWYAALRVGAVPKPTPTSGRRLCASSCSWMKVSISV